MGYHSGSHRCTVVNAVVCRGLYRTLAVDFISIRIYHFLYVLSLCQDEGAIFKLKMGVY